MPGFRFDIQRLRGIDLFVRFCMVGCVGFGTEAIILTVLALFGVGPIFGRFISFPIAVTITWLLNRNFSFRSRNPAAREGMRYFLVQCAGAVVNIGAYISLAETIPLMTRHPVAALFIGSLAGLVVTFNLSRYLVFKPHPINVPALKLN